jgi:excisionase family DNA binding protein
MSENNLINFSQAAELLSVSRPTIYAMIERGELHPVQIADRQYLKMDEVEQRNKRGNNLTPLNNPLSKRIE